MYNFKNRKIALFGDEHSCKRFYLLLHKLLKIEYVFFMQDPMKWNCQEATMMRMNRNIVVQKELLLVLCVNNFESRKYYDEIIQNTGLFYGQDYIDDRYIYQTLMKENEIDINKKNIWIFGAGNNGRQFYEQYHEHYQISGFISNFDEEKMFCGLPVIRPEKLLEEENYYVVVNSDVEDIMVSKLEQLKLESYVQFCFPESFPKHLFVAMGTCQIIRSVEILELNLDYFQTYHTISFLESIYSPISYSDNKRICDYGALADVVFYGRGAVNNTDTRDYQFIVEKYYKTAKKIAMPFYFFSGQIQQVTEGENNYALFAPVSSIWLKGDGEINNLIEQGYSKKDIIDRISNVHYWDENDIRRKFDHEIKKIEVLDRFSSIKIKEFIEKNYKKLLVFYDGIHFGPELRFFIANEVASIIGVKVNSDFSGTLSRVGDIQKLKTALPLYPCVINALNIKLNTNKYPFYNMEQNEMEYLQFEELSERYIEYVMQVKAVMKHATCI